METLLQDIRHSSRMLRRSPGFTATAVAALALGIGANTAIFSVINTVLLRPLPYPDPGRLVQIEISGQQGNANITSIPKFIQQREAAALEDVSAYDLGGPGINLTSGDRPEQLKGIRVSRDYFHLFGATASLGRTFTKEEDLPNAGRFVILSNGFWQRRFGSDPSMPGKSIPLGGEPHIVVGILSPSFQPETPVDIYLPLQADPNSIDQAHYLFATGRIKAGYTLAQARASLQVTAEAYRQKFPGAFGPQNSFTAELLQDLVVANVRRSLYIFFGAVGLVLLIACANVANLLLARATGRAREIAIRTAIGAARSRIIRQLLTESVLLSAVGGLLGLAVGAVGVRALLALNPGAIPRIGPDGSAVSLDWRVAAFTLGLSLLTGILFGLIPALHASRADLNSTIKESGARSGAGLRQNKARSVLIVTEMALAIVLLVGAGLLIRTFLALRTVPPGFDPHHVLTMQTSLTGARFDRTASIDTMIRQVCERVEALPGVQAASVTASLPLEPSFGLGFRIEGRALPEGSQGHGGAAWRYMTARYFEVFKIPIVRGRGFRCGMTGRLRESCWSTRRCPGVSGPRRIPWGSG